MRHALMAMAMAVIGVGTLGAALLPAPVLAETQTFLGKHGKWEAYRLEENGAKTCYIVSEPVRSQGNVKQRGEVVVFVTHRPREGERDVVSFQAGYNFESGAPVTANVDGEHNFQLISETDTAWARHPEDDRKLVAAMIKGVRLEVKGTSDGGVTTTDRYSLIGFTDAHKAINRECKADGAAFRLPARRGPGASAAGPWFAESTYAKDTAG